MKTTPHYGFNEWTTLMQHSLNKPSSKEQCNKQTIHDQYNSNYCFFNRKKNLKPPFVLHVTSIIHSFRIWMQSSSLPKHRQSRYDFNYNSSSRFMSLTFYEQQTIMNDTHKYLSMNIRHYVSLSTGKISVYSLACSNKNYCDRS